MLGPRLVAIVAVMLLFFRLQGYAVAEEAPLARCNVQTIGTGNGTSMSINPISITSASGLADLRLTDNYRRALGGDWILPRQVDRTDPRIRLLLFTGGGPLLIEVSVTVDGLPFREHQERWIDDAMAAAAEVGRASLPSQDGPRLDERPTEEESSPEDDQSEEAEAVEAVTTRTTDSHHPRGRLIRFLKRTGPEMSREEARWLLAQWVPGPSLLELMPGLAMKRTEVAPVWEVLDTDADDRLSAVELAATFQRLRDCDADEDEWIDLSELMSVARSAQGSGPGETAATGGTAPRRDQQCRLVVLGPETDWVRLKQDFAGHFGVEPSLSASASKQIGRLLASLQVADAASLTTTDLQRLTAVPPDVVVEVRFGDDESPGLSVVRMSDHLQTADVPLHAADDVVTLKLAELDIELSAVAASSASSADPTNGQISVGALIDGYPVMRFLDADGDRRLSRRETTAATELISGFDQDQDGIIQRREVPLPVRLVIASGPHVHTALGRPVRASARRNRTRTMAPPDWFASMDQNGDHDLTPGEFLGTRKQFDQLDRNTDQRISVDEATADETSSP